MKKIEFYNLFDKKLNNYQNNLKDKILNTNEIMSDEEEVKVYEILMNLERFIVYCNELKLKFGQIYDYNNMKKEGTTLNELKEYVSEDDEYISLIKEIVNKNIDKHEIMFGYPANLQEETYTTKYLRELESKVYLMNSCGDPYQKGFYGMDNKNIEQEILKLFAKNMNISEGEYWGYITSGGTESNFWAIREGFAQYPKGVLYFSEAAHYSIEKFVNINNNKVFKYEKIAVNQDESINIEELKTNILTNFKKNKSPAIIILTWGTTKKGTIDSVSEVVKFLKEENIPHYIHLDAALYGGIPKNQVNSPALPNFKNLEIDSVSISLHKYIGSAKVNGILIASNNISKKNLVEYIGQEDSTFLGSRDFMAFSIYQKCVEVLNRSKPNNYDTNIKFFTQKAQEKNIEFSRVGNGNIFTIKKPSDRICKKYQLATFTENNIDKAHIIIFPSHKFDVIENLLNEIQLEKE